VGWIGGSYRQDYGAVGFFGVNIKDKFKLGYAYEFATEQTDKIGNGTHEVQVVLRLGKKQFSRPQPVHKTPAVTTEETPPAEEKVVQKTIDPVEEEETVVAEVTEPVTLPVEQPPLVDKPAETPPATQVKEPQRTEPEVTKPKAQEITAPVRNIEGSDLEPGHYVVVGAFANVQNAKNYQSTLKKSGYPAHVSFHPAKGYFIVHMDNVSSIDEARTLRDKYRQMSRYSFRDTWILTIE
jgi:cell division septation protein DedD